MAISDSGHFRICQFKDISHFKSWKALKSDVLDIRGSSPLLKLVHSLCQSISVFAVFHLRLLGVFSLNFLRNCFTRIDVLIKSNFGVLWLAAFL